MANKTFACDTNTGSERLVVSFVLAAPLANVRTVEIYIEAVSSTATVPSWWAFFNSGFCRQQALSITDALPPGSVDCTDWANGMASMNFASYRVAPYGANTAQFTSINGVPSEFLAALVPGVEYSAGSFLIDHSKTVGSSVCPGCDVAMCLIVERLDVATTSSLDNITLLSGANGPSSAAVTWQDAAALDLHVSNLLNPPRTIIGNCVLASTPVRASSWGAVKALYR